MRTYPWKRFWCPREGSYSLSDNGYLYDPDSEDGDRLNPHLAPLAAFADCPCLVMLGGPGIGKSTELESEVQRIHSESNSRGTTVRIDLREYQTDGRLVADSFENDAFRDWMNGSHILNLFFDSLDEGRLEVRNVANIIAGQLRRIDLHAARLRLRIACRAAEWPASLETTLDQIYGEQAVCVIELAPLRQVDIHAAAEAEGINAESFIGEIARKEVQPFAIAPITLKFLLDLYGKSGELPSTKRNIYEAGSLRLCQESSQSRRDARHFGHLSAAQRLEVASRIAAFTLFSGRSVIDTSASAAPNPDVITVTDLAGGWETVRGDRFDVTEAVVREVLNTAVFSSRGPEWLGFAHWTYAEFLSARYVGMRAMDALQIGSLIFHSAHDSRIVPQLAETAAWIAVDDDTIFRRIVSGDPQILLRSDVATADVGMKEHLVTKLIEGFQQEELDDSDWNLRNHYGKLSHPKLASQLEPPLLDKTQHKVTRRFITDLAEECRTTEMLTALTVVALDASDDPHIRSQASHTIVAIGDAAAIEQLKPLALGEAGADPDDELRGSALRGLWPLKLITADELFGSLIQPQNDSLYGAYAAFLHRDLVKHLSQNDLVFGLRWCSKIQRLRGEVDDFHDAVSEIVRRSLSHLSDFQVVEAFAEYVVAKITRHEQVEIAVDAYNKISTPDRRRLVSETMKRIDDLEEYAWALAIGPCAIVAPDDLEWLLEQIESADEPGEQRRWAALARRHFLLEARPSASLLRIESYRRRSIRRSLSANRTSFRNGRQDARRLPTLSRIGGKEPCAI